MDDDSQRSQAPPYGLPLPGMERRTVVTWGLLAINGAVWAAMELSGGSEDERVLLRFGAMFGPLIANGEYWRLFTAMFLHVGIMHLMFNGIGLLIFGRMLERVFGHYRFATIYVLAGLSGSIASYTFNPVVIGAGASGAIFGVLGALTAFFLLRRDVLGNVGRRYRSGLALIVLINLAFGFFIPGIDNWAHLGGLGGGLVLGFALSPHYRYEALDGGEDISTGSSGPTGPGFLARRVWVVAAVVVVLAAWTWLVTSDPSLEARAFAHVLQAERQYDEENYFDALEEAAEAINLDPTSGPAFFIRGKLNAAIDSTDQAASDLGRAMALGLDEPRRAEAVRILVSLGLRN
ncbi:MAG: rhomboid family intramembrane serine protease [Chloroflexi bacterium]|nr:rhomboid family intramembrane serine protease [Chloroflexota bacterium]